MATMNISLPDKMKEWVEKQVDNEKFSNSSEYLRDLIRQDLARHKAIAEIQAALDAGDASGYKPYDRAELERSLGLDKRPRQNKVQKNAA